MPSRLGSIAPDIEAILSTAQLSTAVTTALRVAKWVVGVTGAECEELDTAVATANASLAHLLAQTLDERYFSLQEIDEPKSIEFFSRARAASAIAYALEGNPAESLYEAISATDDLPVTREFFSGTIARV